MNKLSPRLAALRRISLCFRTVCRALLVLVGLLVIGIAIPAIQSRAPSFAGFAVGVASICYGALGLWILDRLFSRFVSGDVLDDATAKWLKRFAIWVGTVQLVPILGRMAVDLMAYGRLGAIRDASFVPAVGCFFVGAFLLMVGWGLEEAAELKAEQSLTV